MAPPIRIQMFGTGDFALPTFERLCETGHTVVRLVTQPDRPQGRKQEFIPSRIKCSAQARGVPVFQPEDVNTAESIAVVRGDLPDLIVTAAYGQILSAALLEVPRLGGINLHGSILPAYRGAAPVARAIERGETETGVTVIAMNPRVDAGGMIAVARTAIDPNETAGDLEDRLAMLGAPLVVESIAALVAGTARVIPQDRALVTRAAKLCKEDGLIAWSRTARGVHDQIRAMKPWPTAYSLLHRAYRPNDQPLRVIIHQSEPLDASSDQPPGTVIEAQDGRLVVATGSGSIRLILVQIAGKKPMAVEDFLRGHPILPGDRFSA